MQKRKAPPPPKGGTVTIKFFGAFLSRQCDKMWGRFQTRLLVYPFRMQNQSYKLLQSRLPACRYTVVCNHLLFCLLQVTFHDNYSQNMAKEPDEWIMSFLLALTLMCPQALKPFQHWSTVGHCFFSSGKKKKSERE